MLLYDNALSGNAYKVRLMLAHLGVPYERVELSVTDRSDREHRLGDKNPALRIPVLQLANGEHLAESNAIIWYLAEATPYLPEDRLERARVLQWMFFEQYDHEPNVAVARYLLHVANGQVSLKRAAVIRQKQAGGRKALLAMERHLARNRFLAAGCYSVADVALYAYTHVAEEAGIGLADYPAVNRWLLRVAGQPGHVEITD